MLVVRDSDGSPDWRRKKAIMIVGLESVRRARQGYFQKKTVVRNAMNSNKIGRHVADEA